MKVSLSALALDRAFFRPGRLIYAHKRDLSGRVVGNPEAIQKNAFWKVGAVKFRRDFDVSRAFHPCDRCGNHAFQCREELLDLPAAPQSVDLTRFSLQLRCALPVGEHNGITAPSRLQVSLDLFLSRACPRRVMTFCNSDAAVSKKHGNSVE